MVTISYSQIAMHNVRSIVHNCATPNRLSLINDWRDDNIQQPHQQFEALYEHAKFAQVELNQLIKKSALRTDCHVILPGQKSRIRAQQKITTELHGKSEALTDLVRGSIIATNIDDLIAAYDYLIQYTDVCGVKNRFSRPTDSGYRDIKLLIRLPNSHFIAEIQLHLKKIASIKNGVEHSIYEQIQKIERQAMTESRLLHELEQQKIKKLRQQSQHLYHRVWQHYMGNNCLAS
ncbi:phosphoribosylglycinamide formyltransferase [Photobacterium kishitanii]|uniref:phosphoribosylglycinamide formyltransferase n=1 Tax=Photobacterium kishitanii TaxID=318456 RepID=UPI000D179049|nr:phosphoribosylglycinamide formyltransferase [Photobacterium kishitanii]PSU19776.1 phosphoribosylglycinamide formyltransferase [Photobacterium kishitanii]